MDLLGIARTVLRHRILSAVIVLATLAGAAGYWTVAPQQWQATANFALINPTAPTDAQITRDPALGRLNSNNPYLGLGDVTTVASVLSAVMTGPQVQQQVVRAGGSPTYTVAPSNEYSSAGKLVAITATAPTAVAAAASIRIVDRLLIRTLRQQQKIHGADDRYLITPYAIGEPSGPTEVISGKLRSVIMLLVAGVIVLFAVLSVAEAVRTRRAERAARQDDPPAADPSAAPVPATTPAAPTVDGVATAAVPPEPAPEPVVVTGWTTPASRPEPVPEPAAAEVASRPTTPAASRPATPAASRTPGADRAGGAGKPARRTEGQTAARARNRRNRSAPRADQATGGHPAAKTGTGGIAWADESPARDQASSGS